jgi:hypothetical protein
MLRHAREKFIALARPGLLGVGVVLLAFHTVGAAAGPALADDALPIAGPYGEVEAKGCDDYRRETEGGYIVIDKDGLGYGSGGECACRIKSVKKTGKNAYGVVASCQCLEGPKETRQRKLSVLSDSEIDWNGSKYEKCKPLP